MTFFIINVKNVTGKLNFSIPKKEIFKQITIFVYITLLKTVDYE